MSYQQKPAKVNYSPAEIRESMSVFGNPHDTSLDYLRARQEHASKGHYYSFLQGVAALVPAVLTVAFTALAGQEYSETGMSPAIMTNLALGFGIFSMSYSRPKALSGTHNPIDFNGYMKGYKSRSEDAYEDAAYEDKCLFLKNNGKSIIEYIDHYIPGKNLTKSVPIDRDPETGNVISQEGDQYKVTGHVYDGHEYDRKKDRYVDVYNSFVGEGKLQTKKISYYPETLKWAAQHGLKPEGMKK